ncbi:hypothetical protein BU23DRAFT_565254 [Bimuria novae-zelandiae CBS 107.79]|uniref:Tc1-like transposase DDE domain-containing protein n=1 Tax=Bimuria novae-zelandiae CBS 107.79 TaxID=1447943 RepID=A0A6A5VQD4_9PLEO|nr:hypothetical protein BU23DRAFT_565254 [Bimuria novae-zelandiae CBS 107.79]
MYEAGYARRAPGFKPALTDDQRRRRFQWALAHNPDKHEYGDGLGFNFRRVIYRRNTSTRRFTYDSKGPYHIYGTESAEAKRIAKQRLDKENQRNKEQRQRLVPQARAALQELGDADANSRAWAWAKRHELKRGDRSRGGVDGYRHSEEVLKLLLVPWINSLYEEGRAPLLLEDGAPAHQARISLEYLEASHIQKLPWPGHSPDVNAKEHA